MKKLLAFAVTIFIVFAVAAQTTHHKIVFDLASADTSDHSSVLRQFNNVLREAPDTELEVVCHGKAIYMLVKDSSSFEARMKELKGKAKVSFKICNNSMRRYGVTAAQLFPFAEVVPVSILELSEKQQQGWSYIRAGH